MEFFAKDMDKNAILCYNEKKEKKKEAKKMFVRDGNLLDTTDWESDRFLQINSAGEQCGLSDYTCLRRRGRRDWLLLLITAGRCEVEYGEKCYSLQSGDFVVYPPHTPQRYAFFEQASSCFCQFSGNAASSLLTDCALTVTLLRTFVKRLESTVSNGCLPIRCAIFGMTDVSVPKISSGQIR
jgi:hypothetical protein